MSPTKPSRNLQYKLLAPLAGNILFLALVLHFYWVPAHLAAEHSDFQQAQKEVIAALNPALVGLLLSDDIVQVHRILEQTAQDKPHWTAVTLIDANGQRLYPLNAQAVAADKRMVNMVSFDEALNYQGTPLGRLQVMVDSTAAIQEETDELHSGERWLLLLLFITTGLIAWLQSRMVTRPLQQLSAAADRLAANDFSAELPPVSQDEVGHLVRAFGTMRESRRLAEAEILRLNASLEERVLLRTEELASYIAAIGQHAIISVSDLAGKIIEVNQRFCEISCYSRSELLGKNHNIVNSGVHPSAFFSEMWATISRGDIWRGEICNRTKNGALYWVDSAIVPVKDSHGQITHYLSVRIDITERKQTQDEILRLNTSLEERVRQRTEELHSRQEELRQSNEDLEEKNKLLASQKVDLEYKNRETEAAHKELESFSYSVSHDLRAPLRGIDGFSQALLEDYAAKLDDQGKDYLQRVRAGTQRMATLIDDMLNLARVTRAPMQRAPMDLSTLAAAIVDELRQTQPEHAVEVVVQPGLAADGDVKLLKILLMNLLANAWKFTGKQERARIEFGMQPNGGVSVYFVRDNGVGFDMTYVGKLFGVFQRLHTPAEFPGTGIGLATVQRIVRRHGGRAWAEGAVGQGATFFFTLAPESAPAQAMSNTRKKQ